MQATQYRPARVVAGTASAATVLLTAAAFWLSYEHLATVAAGNGLPGVRGWAWPATIDLFVVIGELLVLRASLEGTKDWYAYTITASGSLASIALNVAGVGADASPLEYVVAAVPPVAALGAFAALMRQIHKALRHQVVVPAPAAAVTPLQHVLEDPEELVEDEACPLEEAGDPQVSAPEEQTVTQEALVELLVANGEPLPGRKAVADLYSVSDWTARQALAEAKRRLQAADQTVSLTKEN